MPLDAFLLALGAAVLHAVWNILLARERDVPAATAVAMVAAVILFAPAAALTWELERAVWPYLAVTAALQLLYFALLAVAYGRAELSVVYPVARGVAPVLVLLGGIAVLDAATTATQVAGVGLVALGVVLVRGLTLRAEAAGLGLGLAIAGVIASYTLLDKNGVQYAHPLVYLELSMVPAAIAYALGLATGRRGFGTLRAAMRPLPALAGVLSFAAYALVLAALARADAAPVAAVRESSVLIAAGLASVLLGERVGRMRIVGAVLIVGGVGVLALAATP